MSLVTDHPADRRTLNLSRRFTTSAHALDSTVTSNEFFHEWQAFTGTNGHAGATQLKLVFHEQSNPPFFPKVSNYEENV